VAGVDGEGREDREHVGLELAPQPQLVGPIEVGPVDDPDARGRQSRADVSLKIRAS